MKFLLVLVTALALLVTSQVLQYVEAARPILEALA